VYGSFALLIDFAKVISRTVLYRYFALTVEYCTSVRNLAGAGQGRAG